MRVVPKGQIVVGDGSPIPLWYQKTEERRNTPEELRGVDYGTGRYWLRSSTAVRLLIMDSVSASDRG